MDGPPATSSEPADFTNCKFHKKREDGEFFWVIKNGSAGTGTVSDPRRDHRRRSVDHHQLRAEFLQRRRVISAAISRGWGASSPTPLFCVLTTLPVNQGCSEARTAASLVRASPLAGSSRFQRRHHGGALFLTVLRFRAPKNLLIEIGHRFPKGDFTVPVHV